VETSYNKIEKGLKMGILKEIKRKIYNSKMVQREFRKYGSENGANSSPVDSSGIQCLLGYVLFEKMSAYDYLYIHKSKI
jgi:hypothetical protein